MERVRQVGEHLTAFGRSKKVEEKLPGPWGAEGETAEEGHMGVVRREFEAGRGHLLLSDWAKKYGPIYGYYSYEPAHKTLLLRVVLSDIGEVRRILRENPPKARGYESSAILGQGVLSNSNPTEWARQRALIKPAFTTEALKSLLPILVSGAHVLLENSLRPSAALGSVFDLHEELSAYAFLMIGHSALGEEDSFLDRRAKPLREAFTYAGIRESSRSNVAIDPQYQSAAAEIKDFTKEALSRYQSNIDSGCPIKNPHSLISIITSKDKNGTPHFDDKHQSDQMSTFVFAGHETTAHTMSWAILELARNPHCAKKLQAEIDQILPNFDDFKNFSYADLFKFSYLTLVLNEALRLWPVVATGTLRQLAQDTEIKGITIPKGAVLNFSHYNIHRNKEYWGEDAEKFNPERKWNHDAFLPFTIFPRDCLGRNLAMMEMRVVLITLFKNFDVELIEKDKEFKGFNNLTLYPEGGVLVRLSKRN